MCKSMWKIRLFASSSYSFDCTSLSTPNTTPSLPLMPTTVLHKQLTILLHNWLNLKWELQKHIKNKIFAITSKMILKYCKYLLWGKLSVWHTRCSRQLSVHILLETLGHLVKTVQLTNHTTNKIPFLPHDGELYTSEWNGCLSWWYEWTCGK